MAIAHVRSVSGTTFGGVRNQAITASVAGNLLVATVLHQSSGALTVTSNAGGTWVKAAASENATTPATSQYKIDIWYLLNAPSTTTVTFTASPNSTLAVTVSEFSGAAALGGTAAKYTKTLGESGASVTAAVGDLAVSALSYYATTDTATAASPFVILGRTGTSTSRAASSYSVATTAGAKIAGWDYTPEGSPAVYDRASVMAVFTPPAPALPFKIRRNGVDVPVRLRRKVAAVPVDVNAQKTGSGYTTIQSLNLTDPTSIREAFTKSGNNTILTLPAGTFEDPDFNRTNKGMVSMPSSWRGISGVGASTRIRLQPGTSTLTTEIPTERDQATNPYYLITALGGTPMAFERFTLGPGANHLHGGIQARTNANSLTFQDLNLDDPAPGNDWTPPGETFGLNAWNCQGGVLVKNIIGNGNARNSSMIGFNSCRDILMEDIDISNAPWGMPTFWQCINFTTRRVKVYGGHIGLNQEQVGGVIEHYNPEFFPNRDWPSTGGNSNAMHMTFQSNNPAYVASVMRVYEAQNDTGRGATARNGCLMIMKSNNYTVQGGSGQLQQDTAIEVYKTVNGVQKKLALLDMNNTGGVVADPTKNFCVFR